MPEFIDALGAIRAADTAAMVVDVLRAYLAGLASNERTQLPWGLEPELIRGPADVALWSLHVQRGDLTGAMGGAGYGRVAKLLSEATIRLSQLGATA